MCHRSGLNTQKTYLFFAYSSAYLLCMATFFWTPRYFYSIPPPPMRRARERAPQPMRVAAAEAPYSQISARAALLRKPNPLSAFLANFPALDLFLND